MIIDDVKRNLDLS